MNDMRRLFIVSALLVLGGTMSRDALSPDGGTDAVAYDGSADSGISDSGSDGSATAARAKDGRTCAVGTSHGSTTAAWAMVLSVLAALRRRRRSRRP